MEPLRRPFALLLVLRLQPSKDLRLLEEYHGLFRVQPTCLWLPAQLLLVDQEPRRLWGIDQVFKDHGNPNKAGMEVVTEAVTEAVIAAMEVVLVATEAAMVVTTLTDAGDIAAMVVMEVTVVAMVRTVLLEDEITEEVDTEAMVGVMVEAMAVMAVMVEAMACKESMEKNSDPQTGILLVVLVGFVTSKVLLMALLGFQIYSTPTSTLFTGRSRRWRNYWSISAT